MVNDNVLNCPTIDSNVGIHSVDNIIIKGGSTVIVDDVELSKIENVYDEKLNGKSDVGVGILEFKGRQECHLSEEISVTHNLEDNSRTKTTFMSVNCNEGLGRENEGNKVKSVIARLNANVIPHKKHFSPPKSVNKHSKSPKSPKLRNSGKVGVYGGKSLSQNRSPGKNVTNLKPLKLPTTPVRRSKIGQKVIKSPKSLPKSTSKSKKDKISVKTIKENKIKKIIEYFEPLPKNVFTNSDQKPTCKTVDDSVDAKKDTSNGEKVVMNAFSILMQGAPLTTPKRGRLKRLGNASAKKQER